MKELNFEVGSLHRTRGGHFSIVHEKYSDSLAGSIYKFENWQYCSWELDGSYWDRGEHENDLVEILNTEDFLKKEIK